MDQATPGGPSMPAPDYLTMNRFMFADKGDTTGDWIFAFKVGKVPPNPWERAGWDMHDVLQTHLLYARHYLLGKQVLWYGQITVNTAMLISAQGQCQPFCDTVNEVTGISRHLSPMGITMKCKSSAIWTGVTYNADFDETGVCANPNEFSMMVWCEDVFESAVQVTLAGTNVVSMTQTTETGMERATITLWLKIASVFPIDTYSGTIYYSIVNR
jgi:hypothetical protein